MNPNLGAHLSIAGGYTNGLNNIRQIGGSALQIFSSSPRGWHFAKLTPQQIDDFVNLKKKLQIDPVYFHASYLLNLASNDRVSQLSKQSLKHELNIASSLGVRGSIVHLGSFKKSVKEYTQIIANIKEVLAATPQNTRFMIENAGNNKIGKTIEEIALLIKAITDPRLKICLDTCHLYSSGYDLSTGVKLESFLADFDRLIGLDRLELFHFNDSRDTFGSGRDRHENIGQGTVPISTFKLIMSHPRLKHLPFIIETPGFDGKGPDQKNLDILKTLNK